MNEPAEDRSLVTGSASEVEPLGVGNMSVPVYARDRVYHPDVQDHTCSLGKGGCFTTVER